MISFTTYALLGGVCTISLAISVSHRGISCRLSGRLLCAFIVFALLLTSKIAENEVIDDCQSVHVKLGESTICFPGSLTNMYGGVA